MIFSLITEHKFKKHRNRHFCIKYTFKYRKMSEMFRKNFPKYDKNLVNKYINVSKDIIISLLTKILSFLQFELSFIIFCIIFSSYLFGIKCFMVGLYAEFILFLFTLTLLSVFLKVLEIFRAYVPMISIFISHTEMNIYCLSKLLNFMSSKYRYKQFRGILKLIRLFIINYSA